MISRSTVRVNAIVWSILGLVVALLIHFIVLSSDRYNWIKARPREGGTAIELIVESHWI